MRRAGIVAVVVVGALSASGQEDAPLDADYVAQRDAADRQATSELLALAKRCEAQKLTTRAKALVRLVLDLATGKVREEAGALAEALPIGRADEPRDKAIERDVDGWCARHGKLYVDLAAACEKKGLSGEAAEAKRRVEWTRRASLGPSAAAPVPPERAALERVNFHRKAAGLSPVTLDAELCKACRAHAGYLALNRGKPQLEGLKAHEEDRSLPGATDSGARAAKASDINWDRGPVESVDSWMATLYHRIPILEPDLHRIGFGIANGDHGSASVLDLKSGRKGSTPLDVAFPRDKQKDVPTAFGGEAPNPIPGGGAGGFPITLTAYHQGELGDVQAKLETADGKEVACWLSTPASPATSFAQQNTISLIPKAALDAGATYKATFSYVPRGGQRVTRTVTFQAAP